MALWMCSLFALVAMLTACGGGSTPEAPGPKGRPAQDHTGDTSGTGDTGQPGAHGDTGQPGAHGDTGHPGAHGDREHGRHDGGASAQTVPGAPRVRVRAFDFRFETPDATGSPRIEVRLPANIVLVNRGKEPHEFHVEELGFHLHAGAGARAVTGLRTAEPGEYEVVCTVDGHERLGMVATLVVRR